MQTFCSSSFRPFLDTSAWQHIKVFRGQAVEHSQWRVCGGSVDAKSMSDSRALQRAERRKKGPSQAVLDFKTLCRKKSTSRSGSYGEASAGDHSRGEYAVHSMQSTSDTFLSAQSSLNSVSNEATSRPQEPATERFQLAEAATIALLDDSSDEDAQRLPLSRGADLAILLSKFERLLRCKRLAYGIQYLAHDCASCTCITQQARKE